MKCTFLAYKWQFLAGVLPRLLFTGFTFAQPFLINAVVGFVGAPGEQQTAQVAAGLVGATVLVYVGIAVCSAAYRHMTYQLLTMYRGGLASLVFKKTLRLEASSVRDSAPVTLMSTDIESIVMSGDAIHDIWASFIEIPLAIYLLYRNVGIPSLFILIPAFCKDYQTPSASTALSLTVSTRYLCCRCPHFPGHGTGPSAMEQGHPGARRLRLDNVEPDQGRQDDGPDGPFPRLAADSPDSRTQARRQVSMDTSPTQLAW